MVDTDTTERDPIEERDRQRDGRHGGVTAR